MKLSYYSPDKIKLAEYNPRQLTKEQYRQLKSSIKKFGLVDPLIINKNKKRKNVLVGGHQRFKIAMEMGIEEIPCVEVNLDYEKEKELNVRLNKNVGEWDYDSLANYFDVSELIDWGFNEEELSITIEPEFSDLVEENTEKPLEIRIKLKHINQFNECMKDIEELLKKYEDSTFSVSGGEI